MIIRGYKFIAFDRPVTLELGDVSMLLGANGAGKSNIIGFFRMLSYMMSKSFGKYVEIENNSHPCEGQTEQGFMEEVLRPYLQAHGVAGVKSILITTNKKKNARSGMLAYSQAVTDLELLRKMKLDGEYERHIFTTMFDLYALPDDFPGYEAT